MKIVTIIGNRPQFIKTALISREIRKNDIEVLIHTGQHYDSNLSDIFFNELKIPKPDKYLGISEQSQANQTGLMMIEIERILFNEKPDCIIVYGDTNSTLAGALAGTKLNIPIVHIEAGLRSFNKNMPEEINRILTDHISTLLFCPNESAINNLNNEGLTQGVLNCGDVMEEVFEFVYKNVFKTQSDPYAYMTIHRAENTDQSIILVKRIEQVGGIDLDVIWPIHPRAQKQLTKFNITIPPNIKLIKPQGYYKNIELIKNAQMVITDSGGLQKEAYWAGIPCFTLRNETEWLNTVSTGWNVIISPEDNLRNKIENISIPENKYMRNKNISESKLIVEKIRNLI
ncbi:MAG: UDP-N-acetylglucosamine 2-epimerase (non-hydrolyzing) [Candidatus Marinimicrobia bacterium]|nr:UDP-N-acetylglucosamine 2-epimerase (non-hydrolyzing) [Candidatus Neomarinimicrobiota bacterium]